MKALLFGALIGLLIAYPPLLAVAVAVTAWALSHPTVTVGILALFAGLRPRARGWSR